MRRRRLWIAACVLLASCQDLPTAGEGSSDVSMLVVPTALPTLEEVVTDQRGGDADQIELALREPGFGGTYHEDGEVVIWAMPWSDKTRIRNAIENALSRNGDNVPVSAVRFRDAKYDFVELSTYRLAAARMAAVLPITLIDVDEYRNRLLLGIRAGEKPDPIINRLASIGVPPDAILTTEAVFLGFDQTTVRSFTSTPYGGYQISRSTGPTTEDVCTMGAVGRHSGAGPWIWLTASHCSERMGLVDFTDQHQPLVNFSVVGEETYEETWFSGNDPVPTGHTCPYAIGCKYTDVAIYIAEGRLPELKVARPNLNSTALGLPDHWPQYGLLGSRKNPGHPVTLIGSSSGRRNGTIQTRCADFLVHDETDSNRQRYMRCQDLATYTRARGDSGGPVVIASSTDPNAVAIHGIHSGAYQVGSTIYALYTPAINVRGTFMWPGVGARLPEHWMYKWCYTLSC